MVESFLRRNSLYRRECTDSQDTAKYLQNRAKIVHEQADDVSGRLRKVQQSKIIENVDALNL